MQKAAEGAALIKQRENRRCLGHARRSPQQQRDAQPRLSRASKLVKARSRAKRRTKAHPIANRPTLNFTVQHLGAALSIAKSINGQLCPHGHGASVESRTALALESARRHRTPRSGWIISLLARFNSLIARFDSLLDRTEFPVLSGREFRCNALDSLRDFGPHPALRRLHRKKSLLIPC